MKWENMQGPLQHLGDELVKGFTTAMGLCILACLVWIVVGVVHLVRFSRKPISQQALGCCTWRDLESVAVGLHRRVYASGVDIDGFMLDEVETVIAGIVDPSMGLYFADARARIIRVAEFYEAALVPDPVIESVPVMSLASSQSMDDCADRPVLV